MKQKKVFLFVMVLLLSISLVLPCFGSGGQSGTPAGGGSAASSNLNVTGLPILKTKETFSIATGTNNLSKNTFPEKEPVIKAEQDTNMKIEWIEIQGASWGERLNIMFASGDLPDALFNPGNVVPNIPLLTDLTDLIPRYSPVLTEFFKKRPDVKSFITAPDGRIYSLPSGAESPWSLCDDHLFINKAWLDAGKLSVPVTTDDFYNVLKYFKANDMNGNGDKNDEIPFAFCQAQPMHSLKSMFGSFGVLDNNEHLLIMNGVVTYTPTKPEFFEALRYFNKLYSEGLMDPEGLSQSVQQFTSKGRQTPIIYGSFVGWNIFNIVGTEADEKDTFIALPPLKGPKGQQLWNRARGASVGLNNQGFVISKKSKNPEALVRWYDYINSSLHMVIEWDNGPVNKAWVYLPDGRWTDIPNNVPAGSTWGEYRHTLGIGTPGIQCGTIWGYNDPAVRSIAPAASKKLAAQKLNEPFFPSVFPLGFEEASVIQERTILFADIDNYVRNFIAKSIIDGITDAQWNQHLRDSERLNIPRYVKLYQDFYNRSK